MEPMAIAFTVGFSLIVVGVLVKCVRDCNPKPAMKPSRSDGDLTTMLEQQPETA